MKVKEKSLQMDLNSTCPDQDFPSALDLTLSADQDSWKAIQDTLQGFQGL